MKNNLPKVFIGLLMAVFLIQLVSIPDIRCAGSGADWWPMFGHDLTHTRYSSSSGPRTNQVLWSYRSVGAVRPSAAVSDGVVYLGSFGGYAYALDANTGVEIWKYKTGSDVWASPAVADGRVFIGANNGIVYALSASKGESLWNFTTGSAVFNGPSVVGGVVYIASNDGNVYALDEVTGAKIWSFTTAGALRSCPAVVNGVVYIGSLGGGFIYAIDAVKGTQIWSFQTAPGDTFMDSSPAVVGGVVYIGSTDSYVYALDASTGSEVWSYQTGAKVSSSPAVVNSVVYIGSEDGKLYALDSGKGTKIWEYNVGSPVYSSPAVANDVVYIGSWKGAILAVDASKGTLIWSFDSGGVFASPAVANGVLYVGSYDSNVYAFGTPGEIKPAGQQTLTVALSGSSASGSRVASSKVTVSYQSPSAETSYFEVRVDSGAWVRTDLSTSYTFSGLSLGEHVVEVRAVSGSGVTLASSTVNATVSVWVPPAVNAVASSIATVGVISVASLAAAALSGSTSSTGGWLAEKVNDLLPEGVKGWLESFVSSKRGVVIESRTGPVFMLTRLEVIAYAASFFVLTIAFAYAGTSSVDQLILLIPTVIATSVFVGLAKNYLTEVFARLNGVWAEHHLWYFGLVTFILSTLAFKTPFSSPSRIVNHTPKFNARSLGIVASASVVVSLGFGAFFYILLRSGLSYIGSIGLAMCLLMALFDTVPVSPMNGRDIYDWSKVAWAAQFLFVVSLYVLWLLYV